MKVKSLSRPTLSDPMDCSPPGSSVHGIFQARVLEWGAIAFSNVIIRALKDRREAEVGRRKWAGKNRGQSDGIDGQLGATRWGMWEPSEN